MTASCRRPRRSVVLAFVVLLRFRRAEPADVGASPGGWGSTSSSASDSPRRFPSSVVTLYMGIVTLAIAGVRHLQPGAPRRGLAAARPRSSPSRGYTPLLARCWSSPPGARGRERLRRDERRRSSRRSSRAPSIRRRRGRSRVHDKKIDLDPRRATRSARSRRRIRRSSASTSRTAGGSTTGTASSATATTWPATACSCTG